MAFSGAWRASRASRVDGSTYTDPAPKLGTPEASALHMEPTPDVGGSRPPWAVQRDGEVPSWVTDPGESYDPVLPGEAPGLILDVEPTNDHYDGTGAGGGQSLDEARRQGNRMRSQDRGAVARQVHADKKIRAADEVRTTEMYVLDPISAGSRLGTVRGRNSLPENNPDGFRSGQRVRRWTDRKIPQSGLRRHDVRPLKVMTAAAPNVSPEPATGTGNRYASPFSSNIYSRVRVNQSPLARRVPRPWDEDVVTDGSPDDDSPSFQVWGL